MWRTVRKMKFKKSTVIFYTLIIITYFFLIIYVLDGKAKAAPPEPNARFYDFNEQVIDGHIKKPTALYTEGRQKVKFDRLLKLKKSFIPDILNSAKDPIFK